MSVNAIAVKIVLNSCRPTYLFKKAETERASIAWHISRATVTAYSTVVRETVNLHSVSM